ncbi:MAG TPA: cytochrome c oxidase subunit 4 [Nocardioidaceae bacterium]|nr:cytochrome c oxidase subunit 4 [Nocardioidaceae bacterium]
MRAAARTWLVLGAFGIIVAIIFPILTRHILQVAAGSTMLGVFALCMLYIAWTLQRGADTDYADRTEAEAQVGPEHVFPSSWWPPVLALGIALLALGVRFTPILVAIGAVIVLATVVGWILQRVELGHHPEPEGSHAARLDSVALSRTEPDVEKIGHENA